MTKLQYKNVRLLVTNSCPNSCSFCYRKTLDKTRDQLDMSEATAFKAMEFIFRNVPMEKGFKVIPWGGEPLMRFDLLEKLVHRYPQMIFNSNTSGSVMTDEMLDFFLGKGRNYYLVWSMGNAYEKYGSVRAKVEAQPNMAKLVKERRFLINFTVTNYENMVEDYLYLTGEGFPTVAVQQLLGYDFRDEDLKTYTSNFLKIIAMEDAARPVNNPLFNVNPTRENTRNAIKKSRLWIKEVEPYLELKTETFCNSGLEKLFIDTEGGIWQCDGWYMNNMNKLGTIYDGLDWGKLALVQEIVENEKKHLRQFCEGCNIIDVCPNTKCLAMNYRLTGNMFNPYPGFCKFQKATIGMYREYIEKNTKKETANATEPTAR